MLKNIFGKKKNELQEPIGFEPEEHKTPWLGRILLVILAGILLFFGWVGLGDLGDIPKKPERLSQCSGSYSYRSGRSPGTDYALKVPQYSDYFFERTCNFSFYETKAGVTTAYNTAKIAWQGKKSYYDTQIKPLEIQLSSINASIQTKDNEYNTSLRERVAGQPPVGKTPEQLRSELQALQDQKNSVQANLNSRKATLTQLENDLKEKKTLLVERIREASGLYNRAWAGYKLWVFLLEVIFVLPSFGIAIWLYLRLLRRNSPHTIILLPIVAVSAILVARTIMLYFWALFLADLVEIILSLTGAAKIFRVFLFYGGMIFAIVIFGGIVYLLQKRIYSPKRVKARRLRSRKCPYCETPYEFTSNYCAGCGKQILSKCPSCGKAKYIDLKFCPYCGKSKK